MKSFIFFLPIFLIFLNYHLKSQQQYEYCVITTVESIIPGGLGRSRLIHATEDLDYRNFTTHRQNDKDSKQKNIEKSDLKIENFYETKLLNLFSLVGINFQNIASNDAIITSKLNDMAKDGWELIFVTSSVESHCGKDDEQGIFLTRYIFRRPIK